MCLFQFKKHQMYILTSNTCFLIKFKIFLSSVFPYKKKSNKFSTVFSQWKYPFSSFSLQIPFQWFNNSEQFNRERNEVDEGIKIRTMEGLNFYAKQFGFGNLEPLRSNHARFTLQKRSSRQVQDVGKSQGIPLMQKRPSLAEHNCPNHRRGS